MNHFLGPSAALQRLNIEVTQPCALRLADALFGHNATPNNFETASK